MIIVTGGAGFIGSCLVKYLNELGYFDIYIVDQLDGSNKWQNLLTLSFRDLIQINKLLEILPKFDKIDTIYHLGANSSTIETNGDLLINNNYQYTKDLAIYSIKQNIKFIYASSAATYGNGELGYDDLELGLVNLKPLNLYGYSKHLFDLYSQRNDLFKKYGLIGLKYFNIFGPQEQHKKNMQSVVLSAFQQHKNNGKVSLFKSYRQGLANGDQSRDFLYVKDAVKLTYYLANHPQKIGGIYNIGSGEANTFWNLVVALEQALNVRTSIEYIDMPENIRENYQYYTKANMAKIAKTQTANYQLPKKYSFKSAVNDYVNNYLIKGVFKMDTIDNV